MKPAPKLLFVTATALAVMSSTVSCSSEKPGVPSPAPSSPRTSTSSAVSQDVFTGLDACTLLREATDSLGYEEYKPETLESENGCRAKKTDYGNVGSYLVNKEGIDGVSTSQGTKTTIRIGGRDAVQLLGDGGRGTCYIGIAVTKTTRASVGVTLVDGTNEQACADTKVIAEQLAPKLPPGN